MIHIAVQYGHLILSDETVSQVADMGIAMEVLLSTQELQSFKIQPAMCFDKAGFGWKIVSVADHCIVVEKYADKCFVPNQPVVPGQQEVYHGAGPISELKEMMLLHLGL